jgi:hypothetical protein
MRAEKKKVMNERLLRRYEPVKSHFLIPPGKNDPDIRVLAGFNDARWDKLCGKNSLDVTAFGRL